MFLRFGLCDYRCVWCDSKYAVEPTVVKRDARGLTQRELVAEVTALAEPPMWITLSGGNPAMHDLTEFVAEAQRIGYEVSVETQGSLWRPWLADVDHLTVSPKPPSSGQLTPLRERKTAAFLEKASGMPPHSRSIKIVVFDQEDLDWAREFIAPLDGWQTFLSVGTPSVSKWGSEVHEAITTRQTRDQIGDEYAWLCEQVAGDAAFANTRVFPQLHVVAWGHKQGV